MTLIKICFSNFSNFNNSNKIINKIIIILINFSKLCYNLFFISIISLIKDVIILSLLRSRSLPHSYKLLIFWMSLSLIAILCPIFTPLGTSLTGLRVAPKPLANAILENLNV